MAEEDVTIQIDLGMGGESARIWTTDLSYDYVKINAEYRSQLVSLKLVQVYSQVNALVELNL